MNPGSPFVVITSQEDRGLLQLAEMNTRREVPLIVILDEIALANVLVFRLEKDRVLRGELHFHLEVGFRTGDLIVRPVAVVVEIVRVERVAEVSKRAVMRCGFAEFAGAEVGRRRN